MIRGKWYEPDYPEKEWEGKYLNEKKRIYSQEFLVIITAICIVTCFTIGAIMLWFVNQMDNITEMYEAKYKSEVAEIEKINALAQNLDCNYEIWKHDFLNGKEGNRK